MHLRARKLKRYVFIDREKSNYPLRLLCRVMGVSTSGYYGWRKRLTKPPSIRQKTLTQLVRNCYWENRRRYGTRRICAALQKSGIKVRRFRIRRILKESNLRAIGPKRFTPKTTDSKGTLPAPNLLAGITASECAAGKIIIGDITYLPLKNGKWCYLAVWQDKVTRRVIGWSLSDSMTAALVISALKKAISLGLIQAGAIIHSDQGSQYAGGEFRQLLQTSCFRQSMSGTGNCYDNAQRDQFFLAFQGRVS